MKAACLCPTYMRPNCTANVAQLFRFQAYPEKRLYILDDGQTFDESINDTCDDIRIRSAPERFPSLSAKYNYLLDWAMEDYSPDVVFIWENDDIFLPGHISQYVKAFSENHNLVSSRLEHVFAYHPILKQAVAYNVYLNFHSCWAFRPKADPEIRWPEVEDAWFDVIFMKNLVDKYPSKKISAIPSYVYRNPAPEAPNASLLTSGPNDKTWYQRYGVHFGKKCCDGTTIPLVPGFDDDTKSFLDTFWTSGLLQEIYLRYKNTGTNIMGPGWLAYG